jgi:nucleoside-diphosphate kinase
MATRKRGLRFLCIAALCASTQGRKTLMAKDKDENSRTHLLPSLNQMPSRRNAIGDIIEQFEKKGFHILAMKMLEITKHQAEQFYAVHATKPFYHSLTEFMSSGPIVAIALEKENAIADLRELMGATNPANAKEGTIRKKWATSIEHNAITAPMPMTLLALNSASSSPATS